MELYVKIYFISTCLNMILSDALFFAHIAASDTASDDVTN